MISLTSRILLVNSILTIKRPKCQQGLNLHRKYLYDRRQEEKKLAYLFPDPPPDDPFPPVPTIDIDIGDNESPPMLRLEALVPTEMMKKCFIKNGTFDLTNCIDVQYCSR